MKIMVIGLACSGKTTIAQQLGEVLNLPVFHMDKIIWQEDWVKAPDTSFKHAQQQILNKENWIYEGFNPSTLSKQVESADRIIYLNKSHVVITFNYLKRLIQHRDRARASMPEGNVEHFSFSYIKWLWKYKNQDIIDKVLEYAKGKPVVILSTSQEVRDYTRSISLG